MHRCLEFVERSVLGETGTLLNKYLQAHLEKVLSNCITLCLSSARTVSPKSANAPLLIFGELAVLLEKKARQSGRDLELRLKIVVSIYSSVSLFILDSFSLILLGLFQVYKLEKLLTNKGTTLSDGLFPSFQSKKLPLTFVASPSIKGMIKEGKILPLAVQICIITHPQRTRAPFPLHTRNSQIIKRKAGPRHLSLMHI